MDQELRKTANNSEPFRCYFARQTGGGPGFLRLSGLSPLIIRGKNSKNSERLGYFPTNTRQATAADCLSIVLDRRP